MCLFVVICSLLFVRCYLFVWCLMLFVWCCLFGVVVVVVVVVCLFLVAVQQCSLFTSLFSGPAPGAPTTLASSSQTGMFVLVTVSCLCGQACCVVERVVWCGCSMLSLFNAVVVRCCC